MLQYILGNALNALLFPAFTMRPVVQQDGGTESADNNIPRVTAVPGRFNLRNNAGELKFTLAPYGIDMDGNRASNHIFGGIEYGSRTAIYRLGGAYQAKRMMFKNALRNRKGGELLDVLPLYTNLDIYKLRHK